MRTGAKHSESQPATLISPQRLIGLLLALGTLLIYLPVGSHGFSIYDDNDYITQNQMVQNGLTWAGVKWAFTTSFASNWHPLTWLSHMLDCQLFGLNAGSHHLVNVVIHAANSVLLFVLFCRLTGATWAAALIAALFAWNPLRVESVAWAAERKDVLSSFFELLSLWCYTRYSQRKNRIQFYLALLCFALALLAKAMPVTMPFLLLLLDWWPLQRFSKSASFAKESARLAFEKWPFFLLTAGSCVITFLAQRSAAVVSLEHYPLSLRIGNALLSYVKYLAKTAYPIDLSVIYPLPRHLPWLLVGLAGAALAAVTWSCWRTRHKYPYLIVGWLWYLGTLVPVIGLVQVGKQAMADRYSYFPIIGILVAVIFLIKDINLHFHLPVRVMAAVTVLILGVNIGLTEKQLSYWHDDAALFSHALDVTRNNAAAEVNLGMALEQQNEPNKALACYKEALHIAPENAEAHNDLANLLADDGKTNEALSEYEAALRLNPDAALAHCNYGTLLANLGRFDDAMQQYREAARLRPSDPRIRYLMGKTLLRHGKSAEAIREFRHALAINDNDFESLTFLAQILATDEDATNRDGNTAVAFAERANALSGGIQPFVLDVLAMAYAETGHFNEAETAATKAQELATDANLKSLAAEIRQHLLLYQRHLPYRQVFTNSSVIPK